MSAQIGLTDDELERELDRLEEDGNLFGYWTLVFFRAKKVAIVWCLGGCGAALPFVDPFGLCCSVECEEAIRPRRRVARAA